ncbi:MAG: lipopolysaccharide assembly protein LapA domain-containing protein [Stellaceae bacterium]
MRLLFWPAIVILAVLCSLFAISNRQAVSLGLWPLPFLVETRLYLIVFLALLTGFGIGAIVAWAAGHRRRRELRQCRRRAEALERELAATQAHLDAPAPRLDAPAPMSQQSLPAHG